MPGAKKPPAARNNLSAREMWLQAVKGRSSTLGANRKSGLSSTKKTPNEYWVGTLRRSQGTNSSIPMHYKWMLVGNKITLLLTSR